MEAWLVGHVIDRHSKLPASVWKLGFFFVCFSFTRQADMKHADKRCFNITDTLYFWSSSNDWRAQMHEGEAWKPESLDPPSGHYVKRAWHSLRHRPLSPRVLFCFFILNVSQQCVQSATHMQTRTCRNRKDVWTLHGRYWAAYHFNNPVYAAGFNAVTPDTAAAHVCLLAVVGSYDSGLRHRQNVR